MRFKVIRKITSIIYDILSFEVIKKRISIIYGTLRFEVIRKRKTPSSITNIFTCFLKIHSQSYGANSVQTNFWRSMAAHVKKSTWKWNDIVTIFTFASKLQSCHDIVCRICLNRDCGGLFKGCKSVAFNGRSLVQQIKKMTMPHCWEVDVEHKTIGMGCFFNHL